MKTLIVPRKMRARIDARFATAKETADVLGVPSSRVKRLTALMSSELALFRSKNGNKSSNGKIGAYELKGDTGRAKQRADKKSGASGRRHARGKLSR